MTTELTRQDIEALRRATTVSFHAGPNLIGGWGMYIRATWESGRAPTVKTKDLFPTDHYPEFAKPERYERERVIVTQTDPVRYDAFAMVHSSQYSNRWQTIAAFLRKGDIVGLVWRPDYGTNDYLRQHRLHADELHLVIARGKKNYTFCVATSVTPENTARMVRGVKARAW